MREDVPREPSTVAAPARSVPLPATPMWWRLAIGLLIVGLVGAAYRWDQRLGPRGRAGIGIFVFIGIVALFSTNLRAVRGRTILLGMVLQLLLGLFVMRFELGGSRPGYELFRWMGDGVQKFLEFSSAGSGFVFGVLADPKAMDNVHPKRGFVFAFSALPTIVFVSSFFSVLYHLGVLQGLVQLLAKGMRYLMGTSGAETLSAAANVFMGQTEAPLIVKPYVEKMTESELLALMVGGMATISGGVMAVFIGMGADRVAILATSVMAAPCGLYLSKLLLPETQEPETSGKMKIVVEKTHSNVIDAASAGASDGLKLALNIAAMLIAFLAFLAMFDYLVKSAFEGWSLQRVFGVLFSPIAFLMGIEHADLGRVGDLLGTKLVANEFVAYVKLTEDYQGQLSARSYALATFALTGFANFASIGIQLGGIGALAPSRRPDLARLGLRALLAGFVATLVNASLAGVLLEAGK